MPGVEVRVSGTAPSKRFGSCRLLWLVLAALAGQITGPALAQYEQYTPPGQFQEDREAVDEILDRAVDEARFRLGRFFLDPWFGIRDLTYIDNVGAAAGAEKQSDWTATLGAGLRLYTPVGSEATFAVFALPDYSWWSELDDRSRLNGRFGAGLFGDLGRSGIELSATRNEDWVFFSRELEVPVNTRQDVGTAELEIELPAGSSFFLGGQLRAIEYLDSDDAAPEGLAFLEREERSLQAGVRLVPADGLVFGLGVEESRVDFESTIRDRSHSGTSPILQVTANRKTLALSANLARRELDPEPASDFAPYQGTTGRVRLELHFGARFRPQFFAQRNLVFTLDSRWAYFEDEAFGVGFRSSLSRFASVRLFVEDGTNDYRRFVTGVSDRQDEVNSIGGEVKLAVGRYSLTLGATRSRYESTLEGFDREITVIRTGLSLPDSSFSPWG